MNFAALDYIIKTVFKTNILPVITQCNTNCIFCSHKQNPDEIESFYLPKLSMNDFTEIVDFLSPHKKVVIGESATRIMEGEPFLHKDFFSLLSLIRNRMKNTPIQITTNGILLNNEKIEKLVSLGNIELNISVNCLDSVKRKQLLGFKNEQDITETLLLLEGRIKYTGSCVIVPEILDWKDIEGIIAFLDANAAENFRLFLPGHTKLSANKMDFYKLHEAARVFVDDMRDKYSIPIILEPSIINDLQCKVEGVIKDSPAYHAGIKVGDIVSEVNDVEVETRVDAFDRVFRATNPKIKAFRGNDCFEIRLMKPKNTSPGFVVLYDISPDLTKQVRTVVKRNQAGKVLFITSELALNILKNLFTKSDFDFTYEVISARNNFLGGTIKCAGLLTVQDIIDCATEYMKSHEKPDLILLPPIMFDFNKRDLVGRHINELEDILKIKTDTP